MQRRQLSPAWSSPKATSLDLDVIMGFCFSIPPHYFSDTVSSSADDAIE